MWYALFDYIICVCSMTIKIFVLYEHTFPVQSRRCTLNGAMFKQMLHTIYLSKKCDWFYPIISVSFFHSSHSIFYVIIIHMAIKAFFWRRRAHYMILIIEKSEHVFLPSHLATEFPSLIQKTAAGRPYNRVFDMACIFHAAHVHMKMYIETLI